MINILLIIALLPITLTLAATLMNIIMLAANIYWYLTNQKTFVDRIPPPKNGTDNKSILENMIMRNILYMLLPQQIIFQIIVNSFFDK